ncbi:MAG: hypothetical protein KAY24_04825 [Candidatus Eisenbacteria sp.]|nr:hypothetical protein [Candidatus Eisenbacteria bacterium]
MRERSHSRSDVWKPAAARSAVRSACLMRLLTGCLALTVMLTATSVTAADEYERIREKAEEMLVAVNGAVADPMAHGKDSEMEKTYAGYAYLLTTAKLETLEGLIAKAESPEEQAHRAQTSKIIHYHALRAKVASVIDQCTNARRDNTISVEGEPIVLRGLDFRIGLQEDRDTRRKWALAADHLYTGINVIQRSLLMDMQKHAVAMGYTGYYPFLREVEGWDVELIKDTAESLLVETEDAYLASLEDWSQREFGLVLRKMRTYDANRLFFFPSLSSQVKNVKPRDVVIATLADLGFQHNKQRTLKIKVREKEHCMPEARAYPDHKGKVRVTMVPSGQLTDIQDLLGAVGEAEFHYLIPGHTRFEDSYNGTNVLPSAYRALFEMIVEEPAWISEHLQLKDVTPQDVADAFRFRRLYRVREAAGKLIFQLQLHENPGLDPSAYNDVMEKALLWNRTSTDAEGYLNANDDYRSGGLLLGYVLAAQIRDALKAEWADDWFRKTELADQLTRGAAKGYALTLEEFLEIWGIPALDHANLARQLAVG